MTNYFTSILLIDLQLLVGASYCEVLQGIFVIIEILLPTRNLMFVVLWWQYLQMRYMLDKRGHLKEAFKAVDEQITGLLTYR